MRSQLVRGVRGVEPGRHALDGDVGSEGAQPRGGRVDLGRADVGDAVQDLALQVGGLDVVVVDHRQ
jgi:hypothetical protein